MNTGISVVVGGMAHRRHKLLSMFEWDCVHGDIPGLTGVDVMAVLCTLHAKLIASAECDLAGKLRLLEIQQHDIEDKVLPMLGKVYPAKAA